MIPDKDISEHAPGGTVKTMISDNTLDTAVLGARIVFNVQGMCPCIAHKTLVIADNSTLVLRRIDKQNYCAWASMVETQEFLPPLLERFAIGPGDQHHIGFYRVKGITGTQTFGELVFKPIR